MPLIAHEPEPPKAQPNAYEIQYFAVLLEAEQLTITYMAGHLHEGTFTPLESRNLMIEGDAFRQLAASQVQAGGNLYDSLKQTLYAAVMQHTGKEGQIL